MTFDPLLSPFEKKPDNIKTLPRLFFLFTNDPHGPLAPRPCLSVHTYTSVTWWCWVALFCLFLAPTLLFLYDLLGLDGASHCPTTKRERENTQLMEGCIQRESDDDVLLHALFSLLLPLARKQHKDHMTSGDSIEKERGNERELWGQMDRKFNWTDFQK